MVPAVLPCGSLMPANVPDAVSWLQMCSIDHCLPLLAGILLP
jgi:hypothetical protein